MGTQSVSNGMWINGRIQQGDFAAVASWYNNWFYIAEGAVGGRVTASNFNSFRQNVVNSAGGAWSFSVPGAVNSGDRINATFWGTPSANFSSTTYTYTSSGSVTVPTGCNSVVVNQCVGGGGGGGGVSGVSAQERQSDGGAAGAVSNTGSVGVSSGNTVSSNVGGGGTGGTGSYSGSAGSTSTVQVNGNTICSAAGGAGGRSWSAGGSGQPFGTNGTGYGSGGNGQDVSNLSGQFKGGDGQPGYISITLNP